MITASEGFSILLLWSLLPKDYLYYFRVHCCRRIFYTFIVITSAVGFSITLCQMIFYTLIVITAAEGFFNSYCDYCCQKVFYTLIMITAAKWFFPGAIGRVTVQNSLHDVFQLGRNFLVRRCLTNPILRHFKKAFYLAAAAVCLVMLVFLLYSDMASSCNFPSLTLIPSNNFRTHFELRRSSINVCCSVCLLSLLNFSAYEANRADRA